MFKKISTVFNRVCLTLTGFALSTMPALAGLPTIEAPENDRGKGLMGAIKGYAADGGIFLGLLIATGAFLVVANAAVSTFNEVQNGKKKWSDFALIVFVGVVMIVVIIWLASEASKII